MNGSFSLSVEYCRSLHYPGSSLASQDFIKIYIYIYIYIGTGKRSFSSLLIVSYFKFEIIISIIISNIFLHYFNEVFLLSKIKFSFFSWRRKFDCTEDYYKIELILFSLQRKTFSSHILNIKITNIKIIFPVQTIFVSYLKNKYDHKIIWYFFLLFTH